MSYGSEPRALSGGATEWGVVSDLFYPVYERLFDEDGAFVADLERTLAAARIDRPVGMYLARGLAWGAATGLALWIVGVVVAALLFGSGAVRVGVIVGIPVPNETVLALIEATKVPAAILASGVALGSVGFAGVFGAFVGRPYLRSAQRRREINVLLPDAVSFMYALSIGGMNQLQILESMAEAEDTYGEVAREFRAIVQETEYFDTDYRSAIREQADRTPSDEFAQFLTDMLSILDSGGDMTAFLDDKKDQHFRIARAEEKRVLDTLELMSEMYITLSLFPLLLIIVLVLMSMVGPATDAMLYATIYGLVPTTGVLFLLMLSIVKQDEVGDGVLEHGDDAERFADLTTAGPLESGLVAEYAGGYRVFDRIERRGGTYRTLNLLRRPDLFFRDNPYYTLAVTVPGVATFLAAAVLSGALPVTWGGILDRPLWSTTAYLYVPLVAVALPLAVFWEWNRRSRRAVLDNLAANLRKLASANAIGLTLLDSIEMVAETSPGKLAAEFEIVHAKCTYGMHLRESLVVFNNKYRLPRLARTLKLVGKANEISGEIAPVLSTAARATENRDEIERDRKDRARMQVAIILMTYLTMLAVMAVLKLEFIDVMAEFARQTSGTGSSKFGAVVDVDKLSLLFFHTVTLQAVFSGLSCGYIRETTLTAGLKYVVGLLALAFATWVVVG